MRGIVCCEVRQRGEEGSEAGGVRSRRVLGVEFQLVVVVIACEGECHHCHGPAAYSDGGKSLALRVEIDDETGGHVPVTLEI